MCLDCLLATFVLLDMMQGNDPDVGDFIYNFFTHMNNVWISFPSQFQEGFMLVRMGGICFELADNKTALLLFLQLQEQRWSAVAGCISRFGWKQSGLADALPGTCDSGNGAKEPLWNIGCAHTVNFFLPQHQPQKGKGSPGKAINPVRTSLAGSKWIPNHFMPLEK